MQILLEKLHKTKVETEDYFGLPDDLLARKYEAEKWNVRYLLNHLADAETVLFERIRRIISEPKKVIWAFDESLWAKNLDYSKTPLNLSKNLFSATRDSIIYYAELHYEGSEHFEFVHSETGIRTLKDEFDKVASHNEHHLAQIRKAVL
jgi:hypothetical protein